MQYRPSRSQTLAIGVLGLIAIAAFYVVDLSHTPVYFGGDEAHFGVQAYSIAHTGRSLDGEWFPLFVKLSDPLGDSLVMPWGATWYQPFLFYLIALVLTVAPLSEAWVRLPTALIGGVMTPLLVYVVAFRLLQNRAYAMVAAVLIGLAPVQVILSRQALDYGCPLIFVLVWLWALSAWIESRRPALAVAIGVVLGAGCYSYIASWFQMPVFLLMTWWVFWRVRDGAMRFIALSAAGFAGPLIIMVPWLWWHPDMLIQTIERYRLGSGVPSPPLWRVYASFFDPVILFVRGGPVPTTSTSRIGMVLLPMAVLVPAGLTVLWRRRHVSPMHVVLLAGFFFAPVAAALKGEPGMVQRNVVMLPFATLIAAYGLAWLRSSRRAIVRTMVVLLLATMPFQFAWFFEDYLDHYKRRSAFYYDPVDFVDIAAAIIEADAARGVPAVYLSSALDDAGPKWRFYATQHHRESLLPRTHYFVTDGLEFEDAPAGSLMVVPVETDRLKALTASGRWRHTRIIYDWDRREAAAILLKMVG